MKASANSRNRLRIIGGDWRSRVLQFPALADLRPTPDRVRETLFNWLQGPIVGARCLDLFAGSGALGFEALSRGAIAVTALELDPHAAEAIRQNAALLKTEQLQLLQRNALDWLAQRGSAAPFDLVFLDPPYAAGLYAPCSNLLQEQTWLAPGALVYVEAAEPLDTLGLPAQWRLVRSKRAGSVYFGLYQGA
jgi:16S rRNA (guanine966-N2)-methyltransferase